MGLNQADKSRHRRATLRVWLLPGITVVAAVLLEFTGDQGRELLRFDRLAISGGELWRLISGHLVHLGWSHLALNAIGLLLVWYLVAKRFSAAQWLLSTLIIIAGIDAGFWFLEPQLAWYVGLSGLLHGLLVAGVTSGIIKDGHLESWIIAGLLAIKLLYEQLIGPLPGSESASGGGVVVAAHLYGAIAGGLVAIVLSLRKRPPASL